MLAATARLQILWLLAQGERFFGGRGRTSRA
jgi:hypothetical protein